MRIEDLYVSGLTALEGALGAEKSGARETEGKTSFKEVLQEALEKQELISRENADQTLMFLTGASDDIASTLISAQKAELTVSLAVAVRNKAIEAYKEIMNMQV